jgi:nitrile hydratase beta subunit
MDGIHDLGGKQGFGPVDVNEPEEAFHSEWEARAYGVVRAMKKAPDWTIDRFRFTREQIEPADYLLRPYYDQWLQCYAVLMVESGKATVEELAAGHAKGGSPGTQRLPSPADVAAERASAAVKFDRAYTSAFRFKDGDAVITKAHMHGGHTRLPGYARGCRGKIFHVRGAFVLPDDAAHGVETAEPLYTVAFKASEFWPDDNVDHVVHIDVWERYLEPA